jgi:hypothetical protein
MTVNNVCTVEEEAAIKEQLKVCNTTICTAITFTSSTMTTTSRNTTTTYRVTTAISTTCTGCNSRFKL